MATFGATREILSYQQNYKLPQNGLDVEGNVQMVGNLQLTGNISLTGDLLALGTIAVNTLNVSSAVTLPANQVLPKAVTTVIDISDGGTAEEDAVVTLPAGSILLGVIARVTQEADGNDDLNFEVGVTGATDAYIHDTDFDPSAAVGTQACSIGGANNGVATYQYLAAETEIIATWTHTDTGDGPTEGLVAVTVIYI